MKLLVKRKAFVCRYCEAVYADEPVSSCDCMGYLDQVGPHFIQGKIEYRLKVLPSEKAKSKPAP